MPFINVLMITINVSHDKNQLNGNAIWLIKSGIAHGGCGSQKVGQYAVNQTDIDHSVNALCW